MQHLIENKSYCPNITLGSVRQSFENLNGHVKWGSNSRVVLHSPGILFGESEITYFYMFLCDKYIGRFQISK